MNLEITKGLTILAVASLTVSITGCVTQSEFNDYKQEMEQKFSQQAIINDNLDDHVNAVDCELNTDFISNDEPDPTRRDEPSSTRRDECEARTSDMKNNPAYEACKTALKTCLQNTTNTQCYQDFQTCITT